MNSEYANSGVRRSGTPYSGANSRPGASSRTGNRRPTKRRKKLNPRFLVTVAIFLAVILVICICIASCSKPTLKGRWDLDGNTIYEFYGKGKGALVLLTAEYEFDYETKDGVLYIDFVDDRASDATYEYEINKGVLFLNGGPGDIKAEYVLTKD